MNNPLPPNLIISHADGGRLLRNLVLFSEVLRRAGFGSGAQTTAAAATALSHIGVEKRAHVFWALAAVFVEKYEQLPLFLQAFNLFWRNSAKVEESPLSETEEQNGTIAAAPWQQSVSTLLQQNEIAQQTHSAADTEYLAKKDFASMNKQEWQAAMQINQTLAATLPRPPSRRKQAANKGKLDMRRTVRRAFSRDGDLEKYYYSRRGEKSPRLIILADISGSMNIYSRAFLHFIAGMFVGGKTKAHAFLLGTRLTCARPPRGGDADTIAAHIAAAAEDWDGGTRLTPLLREFNCHWLRRLHAADAIVLFATDGLEVNFNDAAFTAEITRLQKSCRRLIWLNPLLRYEQYQPLARGANILSKTVDETYSIHNLHAASQLAQILTQSPSRTCRTRSINVNDIKNFTLTKTTHDYNLAKRTKIKALLPNNYP